MPAHITLTPGLSVAYIHANFHKHWLEGAMGVTAPLPGQELLCPQAMSVLPRTAGSGKAAGMRLRYCVNTTFFPLNLPSCTLCACPG